MTMFHNLVEVAFMGSFAAIAVGGAALALTYIIKIIRYEVRTWR